MAFAPSSCSAGSHVSLAGYSFGAYFARDGAVGSGEAVNGYTVSLKSAKTDGYSVYILMSITAPEDVNLENATAGESHFALDNPSITGYNGGLNRREDGDGLDNTCDLLLQRSYMTDNGGPAITKDSVLNMYFEDIYHKYWDGGERQELISEGVWSIDISFEESDFREIELLQEPIVAKASVGWKLDLRHQLLAAGQSAKRKIDMTKYIIGFFPVKVVQVSTLTLKKSR